MIKNIANITKLSFDAHKQGDSYQANIAFLSKDIGASNLGCNITSIPLGKKDWPFHSHHENEELFLTLFGQGEMRMGTKRFPIKSGVLICAPVGGSETAHQLSILHMKS
jgi:uncharacterized cupin superfamily protein